MERDNLQEHENQGMSRRDLLKKGAALGGTVMWVTPVVQTLGMGRAFAGVPSPPEEEKSHDISYVALTWTCNDGDWYYAKYEVEGGWESDLDQLVTPHCSEPKNHDIASPGDFPGSLDIDDDCVTIDPDDEDCEIHYTIMGGRDCASGQWFGERICLGDAEPEMAEPAAEELDEHSEELRNQVSEEEPGLEETHEGGTESDAGEESGGEESGSEDSGVDDSDVEESDAEDSGDGESDVEDSGDGESDVEDSDVDETDPEGEEEGEPSDELLDGIEEILDEGEK